MIRNASHELNNEMIAKKSWEEFRKSKLLWFVNRVLQVFGWIIVFNYDGDNLTEVYPARTCYRGFDGKTEEEGCIGLYNYLDKELNNLEKDITEGP